MRVLLYTFGSRGDVQPLVALAVEIQKLGAQALVCAPPDFTDLLARARVPMRPTGPSVHELVHVRKAGAADAPALAAELVADQFDTLDVARGCDAVVATGLMPAGMRSVAELAGVPYVCAMLNPLVLPSPHRAPLMRPGKPFPPGVTDNQVLWDVDAERVQALYGPALNTERAAAGLPPISDVRDHVFTDQPWLAIDPVLSPPDGTAGIVTGAWLLRDDRPLPADLEMFLAAGTPPIYVGFGSVRVSDDAALVAIEAIRAQGYRTVLGSGWANLTAAGDDCFVVGEVNQQELFGRVAAVVHHGGAGTTTTATLAGVPQLVVPQIADQPYFASRVSELGIGVAHDGPTPTVESLAGALTLVLNPDTHTRATAVAGTVRTDGAATAAKMLLNA